MIDSHLSRDFYNTIARYYDAENEDMVERLDIYSELTKQAGCSILDIGCGMGRVMLHLAMEGHSVSGIDTSVAMLERGRRKLKNRVDLSELVTFYEGDALDFTPPEKYALILVPYNGLMHFRTPDETSRLLRHLKRLLTNDGLLDIDL